MDQSLSFRIENLDSRGVIIKLDHVVDSIIRGHDYPLPVGRLLGEAITLAVIFNATSSKTGRFQLQTKTDGAVPMLVVDIDAEGHVRGYARIDEKRLALYGANPSSKALLGRGYLALTIEPDDTDNRYQGIVALEAMDLEAAAHAYFAQSEQIPTRVRLACKPPYEGTEILNERSWRAGGLLAQSLPKSSPFKDPESPDAQKWMLDVEDHWREAEARTGTAENDELTDPALSREELLVRLFHPHDVRVHSEKNFIAQCRCSSDRIMDMLKSFDAAAVADMAESDGNLSITCEFCSTVYRLPLHNIIAGSDVGHG